MTALPVAVGFGISTPAQAAASFAAEIRQAIDDACPDLGKK